MAPPGADDRALTGSHAAERERAHCQARRPVSFDARARSAAVGTESRDRSADKWLCPSLRLGRAEPRPTSAAVVIQLRGCAAWILQLSGALGHPIGEHAAAAPRQRGARVRRRRGRRGRVRAGRRGAAGARRQRGHRARAFDQGPGRTRRRARRRSETQLPRGFQIRDRSDKVWRAVPKLGPAVRRRVARRRSGRGPLERRLARRFKRPGPRPARRAELRG